MTASTDLRQQILAASVKLIESEGLAALSMREVARRAGVSHQAPYHYFPDRESILAAIAWEGFERLRAALEGAAQADGADAIERLERGGRAYVAFATSNPAHFRVMFRPELVDLSGHPEAQAEGERAFMGLQSLVGGLVSDGVITREELAPLMTVAWSMVHGLASLLLDGPVSESDPGTVGVWTAFSGLLRARARSLADAGPAVAPEPSRSEPSSPRATKPKAASKRKARATSSPPHSRGR